MTLDIFSAYPSTWMVIFGAAVVGALCLNSLLKRLPVKSTVRRRNLRRASVATVFAGFVIPVAVPGALQVYAPAFIVLLFESTFQAEGDSTGALMSILIGVCGVFIAVLLLAAIVHRLVAKISAALATEDNG